MAFYVVHNILILNYIQFEGKDLQLLGIHLRIVEYSHLFHQEKRKHASYDHNNQQYEDMIEKDDQDWIHEVLLNMILLIHLK